MNPDQYFTDLEDRITNDFRAVLPGLPHWFSEPTREAIDTMMATIATTLADHKAAKQAQG